MIEGRQLSDERAKSGKWLKSYIR